MSLTKRYFKSDMKFLNNVVFTVAICATTLSGCKTAEVLNTSQTINQGYVVDQETLALAPVGSSREQVLLSLGTPSSTATFDNEVFYYISQKRKRAAAFLKPKIVEQSVLAVYFDKDGNVERLGHYTLQDGKVFDMISRVTPTGGAEVTFLGQLLRGGANPGGMIKNVLGTD
jgi:outer membrane protein assembly factor BamE (lipoprotein component of BamABCDE complex)